MGRAGIPPGCGWPPPPKGFLGGITGWIVGLWNRRWWFESTRANAVTFRVSITCAIPFLSVPVACVFTCFFRLINHPIRMVNPEYEFASGAPIRE